MEQTIIGKRVHQLRRQRGLTAPALAALAGVTENAIRKLESGDSKEPRFSTGLRIARALEVDPEFMLGSSQRSHRESGSAGPDLAFVVREIRAHRVELHAHRVRHVDVFGSVARGDSEAASDIDLIIDPDPDAPFSLFDLSAVEQLLTEILGHHADAVSRWTIEQSHFASTAASESVRAF